MKTPRVQQRRGVRAECACPWLCWELAVLPTLVQQEGGHTAHFPQQSSCCFLEQPTASCVLYFGIEYSLLQPLGTKFYCILLTEKFKETLTL